jgi:hypothetical protein
VLRFVAELCAISSRLAASSNPRHRHLARYEDQPVVRPGIREVGKDQGLSLIAVQQNSIVGPCLLTPYLETQSDAVDLVGILPIFQRVSRTAPTEPS